MTAKLNLFDWNSVLEWTKNNGHPVEPGMSGIAIDGNWGVSFNDYKNLIDALTEKSVFRVGDDRAHITYFFLKTQDLAAWVRLALDHPRQADERPYRGRWKTTSDVKWDFSGSTGLDDWFEEYLKHWGYKP